MHRGKLGRSVLRPYRARAKWASRTRKKRQRDAGATGSGHGVPCPYDDSSRNEDLIRGREGKRKSGKGEEPFPLFGGGGLFFLPGGNRLRSLMVKTNFREKCYGIRRVFVRPHLRRTGWRACAMRREAAATRRCDLGRVESNPPPSKTEGGAPLSANGI